MLALHLVEFGVGSTSTSYKEMSYYSLNLFDEFLRFFFYRAPLAVVMATTNNKTFVHMYFSALVLAPTTNVEGAGLI